MLLKGRHRGLCPSLRVSCCLLTLAVMAAASNAATTIDETTAAKAAVGTIAAASAKDVAKSTSELLLSCHTSSVLPPIKSK